MTGTLPVLTLECSGCGHRWPTRARAGCSIRCPKCRRGRRVPASRPRTAAQARAAVAAGGDDGLAAAWEAEQPLDPGRSGQHSGEISTKARGQAAEHQAAIDRTAARHSAQLADPEAARIAADQLAVERAAFLDQLAELRDALDVEGFPRGHPYGPARAKALGYLAVSDRYEHDAGHADTLDQLHRIAADADRSFAGVNAWIDHIDDLRRDLADLADLAEHGPILRLAPEPDDDQAPDDDGPLTPQEQRAAFADYRRRLGWDRAGTTGLTALRNVTRRALPAAPVLTARNPCERCRAARRSADAWPPAVAQLGAEQLCGDHLADARQHAAETGQPPSWHMLDPWWSAYDRTMSGS